MLSSSSPESNLAENQKSLQIKEDDKFFSRLVSKESSMSNPSFRVYYGGVSGSIPFLWESRPGTPKHSSFSDTSLLPPLTPPPSSYSHNPKQPTNKRTKSKLSRALFTRINLKKTTVPLSPTSSSSLSSSSSSSLSSSWSVRFPSVPIPRASSGCWRRRVRFSSSRSSFDGRVNDDDDVDDGEEATIKGLPVTSTLCFGIGNDTGGDRRRRGDYAVVIMKKAFLAMVGRRSG
ncbi:hypothetical protein U1Q18_013701 [Sarracenia purpurea var. burkii]